MCRDASGFVDAMPVRYVELLLYEDPDQPTKTLELHEGVTVAEVRKELGHRLGVPPSALFVAVLAGEKGDHYVKLLAKEEICDAEAMLGGVEDMSVLPELLTIKAKKFKDKLPRAEALQIMGELMAVYKEPKLQAKVNTLQKRITKGELDGAKYPRMLAEIIRPAQRKVYPNWGFEASNRGIAMYQGAVMHLFEAQDQDIIAYHQELNRLIGLDYAWMDESERLRLNLQIQALA